MSHSPGHWWPAYVGLGSNLDDPPAQLARACTALAQLPETRVVKHSSLYRSEPLGPQDQPAFLNGVVALCTRLPPLAMLHGLQRIEQAQGRVRTRRWGPRTLDLDLLAYAAIRLDGPQLELPHPRIAERNFVLLPLAEIAPTLVLPGLGSISALAARASLDEPRIEKLKQAMTA